MGILMFRAGCFIVSVNSFPNLSHFMCLNKLRSCFLQLMFRASRMYTFS